MPGRPGFRRSRRRALDVVRRAAPATRTRALQALLELPERIGLESLRTLAPLIGHLHQRHRLNALGIEVLAAAVHLQADVYLSAPSPRLEEALRAEHRHVVLVP